MKTIEFLFFFVSGFIAQLIDGSIGMGFGVTCTSLLTSGGIGPALASAVAHIAEIFTTAASGISHFKLGNIKREIVKPLVITGVIGGGIGAVACVYFSAKSPTARAAIICKKLPVRILGILVGATLMLLSTRNILMAAGLM